jgi:drug/metabolite transporter (DMT)-like permease
MPLSSHHAVAGRSTPLGPSRIAVAAAFAALYLIWGSTYLAIRIAVESAPPFLLAGLRFVAAGMILLLWRRFRGGVAWPTRAEWIGAGCVGACLVLLSNAALVFAERSIPSGMTALFAAGTPLLIAIFNSHRTGTALGVRLTAGLVLGTIGMIVLGSATLAAVHEVLPLLLLALASVAWAVGTTYGQGWRLPRDVMTASAVQMLVGGVLASLVGIAAGEGHWLQTHTITAHSALAWAYLAVVGSLVAYPVFQWLLSVADATAVASYTYVNPIVAVSLGVILRGEVVTGRMVGAAISLIPAVILVVTGAPKKELRVQEEEA